MGQPAPKIRVLGSGTAFHTDGRGSSAILCRSAVGSPFLVDAGPTVVAACERYRVDCGTIDRLFVTHLHGDHFAGWPFLRLNLAFQAERTHPFEVHGAKGTRDAFERLEEICYGDLFGEEGSPFDVRYREHEVAECRGLVSDGMRFDLFPMDHHPTSVAYRYEIDGKFLGVTGDTRWCDNLERLAEECDLLVMECTTRRKEALAHVSLEELRRGIGRLGARRVLLVHLTDAVATELAADPIPRVVVGHDGMDLEL